MNWITITGPNGRRKVEEGATFILALGESVVGSESDGLQDHVDIDQTKIDQELAEISHIAGNPGFGMGDMIAILAGPVALVLGKTNCASCEVRKMIFNVWRKLGAKAVWKLVKMSLDEPPETVAARLREILEENHGP